MYKNFSKRYCFYYFCLAIKQEELLYQFKMARKHRADLSESANNKLLQCEKYLQTISTEYTPESCLKMMEVCEVRNKALQGHMKDVAECNIGETNYK